MTQIVNAAVFILVGVVFGLAIFAGAKAAELKEAKNQKKRDQENAKIAASVSEIRTGANEQKESMETGSGAADFDASLSQLHQHATKRK